MSKAARYIIQRFKSAAEFGGGFKDVPGGGYCIIDREENNRRFMFVCDHFQGGKDRARAICRDEVKQFNKALRTQAATLKKRQVANERAKDWLLQAQTDDIAAVFAECFPQTSIEDLHKALVKACDLRAAMEWNASHVLAHEYAAIAHKLAQVQLDGNLLNA